MADSRFDLNLYPIPVSAPGRARIAVIDDDCIFVDLMHDLLANGEGYEVISQSQWVQGYEIVKTTQPDLVILDLIMGREESGWVVLELLRDDPATAHIPVVVCSAAQKALHQHSSRMSSQANVASVTKPFDVDHLLAVIAGLLEHSRRAQLTY